MSQLRITCFNSFACTLAGTPVTSFYSANAQALLVYVAVNQEQPHLRSVLAGLLWPDYPEKRARRNLSQTLTALRKSIEGGAIGERGQSDPRFEVSTQAIALNTNSDIWIDAVAFAQKVRAVREHTHPDQNLCSSCMDHLQDATKLYTGPFLANFAETDSDLFYDWVLTTREHLQQESQYAFTQLGRGYAAQGLWDEAIGMTRRVLDFAPWQEEAHQQLMRLYAWSGQRSQALSQYTTCSELLMDEFGVAPSAETDALYDQILAGEIQVSTPANSGAAVAVENGAAETRDLALSIPYYSTLPPLEELIDRDAELGEFTARLQKRKCVPIIGMTGVGKSALARHIAQRWMEENGGPERVFWHEFYPHEAAEIIERFAGFLATHGRTAPLRQIQSSDVGSVNLSELRSLLATEVANGHFLLCLDNIHTVENEAEFDPFLGKLLNALHHGNSALMLVGQQLPRKLKERRYVKFRTDDLGGISADGVRELLSQTGVQNGLADQIHAVTDGNAEILTLIRAWVDPGNLVADLLNELYNVEAINEFMLYKIHEELAPRLHQIMAVIAAFLGHPAPREAIEQVLEQGSILADIRTLKERHLIRELVSEKGILTSTYRIHDIVRGFYYQRLGSSERLAIHRQIGQFYQDRGNTLRAIQQFDQAQEADAIADLIIEHAEELIYRGHLQRIKQLLESIEQAIKQSVYPNMAAYYQTLGLIHRTDGDYARAHDFYAHALALIGNGDDDSGPKAEILLELGNNGYEQNDYEAALGYFSESYALYEALSDPGGQAKAFYGLGRTYYRQENVAAAQTELEACKALAMSLDDNLLLARCELTLGLIDWQNDALPQAQERFSRALVTFDQQGEFKAKAHALINVGILEYELGNSEASLGYYNEALELCETMGDTYSMRIILHNLGYHFLVHQVPSAAIPYYLQLIKTDQDESSPSLSSRAYSGLAQAHLALGAQDEALDYAKRGEKLATIHGLEAELGIALRVQGEICTAVDQAPEETLQQARVMLEQSVQLLSQHQEKDELKRAEFLLAMIIKQMAK